MVLVDGLVLNRHLTEAVADLGLVLRYHFRLVAEEIDRFLVTHRCLVNRLTSVVKFLECEQVGCEDIIDIECPQIPVPEFLPRWTYTDTIFEQDLVGQLLQRESCRGNDLCLLILLNSDTN